MEQPFIETRQLYAVLIVKVSGQISQIRKSPSSSSVAMTYFHKLHRPLAAVSNERHESIRQFRVIASFTRKLQQIEGAIGIAVHNHLRATNRRAKLVPSLIARSYNSRASLVLVAQQIA